MNAVPRRLQRSSLILIALLFVLWALCFIRLTSFVSIDGARYYSLADDAMISMRYAWNLAHGAGLSWNPGERVEGYTNLLMVLAMSVPMLVMGKSAAVLCVQVAGIVCMLLVAVLTRRIAEQALGAARTTRQSVVMTVLFAFPLLYYPLTYWALMGMETALLACCLLYATWRAMGTWGDVRFTPCLPCVLGLAYLTRPDVLPLVFAIVIYRGCGLHGQARGRRTLVAEGVLLASIGLAHLAFRWYYYGELVPNTYLLKIAGIPAYYRVRNGIGYILPFLYGIALPLALVIFGVLKARARETMLLLTLVMLAIFATVMSGGDAWPYWRMTAPVMPLLAVACAVELSRMFAQRSAARWATPLIASAVVLQMLAMNYRFLPEMSLLTPAFNTEHHEAMVATAVALNDVCASDATIAVTWAGIIPYYTGLYAIAMLGQNDKYIAMPPPLINREGAGPNHSRPGHNRYDLPHSLVSAMPDYFQTYWVSFGHRPQDVRFLLDKDYWRIDLRYRANLAIPLFLKQRSPRIRWDRLPPPSPSPSSPRRSGWGDLCARARFERSAIVSCPGLQDNRRTGQPALSRPQRSPRGRRCMDRSPQGVRYTTVTPGGAHQRLLPNASYPIRYRPLAGTLRSRQDPVGAARRRGFRGQTSGRQRCRAGLPLAGDGRGQSYRGDRSGRTAGSAPRAGLDAQHDFLWPSLRCDGERRPALRLAAQAGGAQRRDDSAPDCARRSLSRGRQLLRRLS